MQLKMSALYLIMLSPQYSNYLKTIILFMFGNLHFMCESFIMLNTSKLRSCLAGHA